MLQTIRDRATGWIAYVIVGLLIIPFALWGVNSYFGDPAPIDAAEVGDSKISLRDFQQAYQRQRQRLQSMFGENFDPGLLDEDRLKFQVLQQLVDERVLLQAARDEGFRIGDQRLLQELRSIEAFQKDGVFDPERYQQRLRVQGYAREGFEGDLRVSLATEQLRDGLVDSSVLTPAEVDRLVGLLKQKRDVSYLTLVADSFEDETPVDAAEIEAYFKENEGRFQNPEQVKLSYLELNLDEMAAALPIADEEIRAAYDEQVAAKYTQAEERGASHILVKIADNDAEAAGARARAIYDEIAAGAITFEQAMEDAQAPEAEGIEAAELGVISQGLFDDPGFEAALYGLEEVGEVSEPVQTSFGIHIIRLDEIIAEQVKDFAEVRDEVERELRLQQAEARFYDATEILTNLTYENPDSLETAAEALELETKESDWLTRQGGSGIGAYPRVIELAFSEEVLDQGLNSEPLEVEPSHVIVIRVQSHEQAKPRSLDEVRDEIISAIKADRARDALKREADDLLKQAAEGKSLQEIAAESGGEFKALGMVERDDPQVDRQILGEAFRLPAPAEDQVAVGATDLGIGRRALVAVSRVVPGKVADLEEDEREALVERLSSQLGTSEFQAVLSSLRQQTKIVTYRDRL